MTRAVTVGAAQLGPIEPEHDRAAVVERLLALLHEAHARGCELVVYPELGDFPLTPLPQLVQRFPAIGPLLELVPLGGTAADTIARKVPSPGVLALLGLAGLVGCRGRATRRTAGRPRSAGEA